MPKVHHASFMHAPFYSVTICMHGNGVGACMHVLLYAIRHACPLHDDPHACMPCMQVPIPRPPPRLTTDRLQKHIEVALTAAQGQ